jgi:uncharacterized protein YjbI with pentapeptide repeats
MEAETGDPSSKAAKYLDFRHAIFPDHVDMRGLPLSHARFDHAILKAAKFNRASLSGARFDRAVLERANFSEAKLDRFSANRANLEGALFIQAALTSADLRFANLDHADFRNATLAHADLSGTSNLSETDFRMAHFEGANLERVHFEGRRAADGAILRGADLRSAFFDDATNFNGATLFAAGYTGASVADTHWGDANLAVINLAGRLNFKRPMLGDEQIVSSSQQLHRRLLQGSARANRQMELVLSNLGLEEASDYFAYRAKHCERLVQRAEGRWSNYFVSSLLDWTSGYGYRLRRVAFTYFGLLILFALIYISVGLKPDDALLTSFTALHGRVFSSEAGASSREWIAGIEALFGLGIESVIVALILQRFFNK